ncbi:MAG: class I SAM-dependent methyltransferase, partial [Chloroflexota bacterium]|nr:class I SAM-dependent methyltransferase [Chloroflexota bacterium]
FVRADIYDWLAEAARGPERFDLAFSFYGAIPWLSDIRAWARGIAAILEPGGRFALVEFHPFAMVFDEGWQLAFPYFAQGKPLSWESGIGDYVAVAGGALSPSGHLEGVNGFTNPHPGHEFPWGLGEVVTALLDAGLALTALEEYPYANGCKQFNDMRETPGGAHDPAGGRPRHPPDVRSRRPQAVEVWPMLRAVWRGVARMTRAEVSPAHQRPGRGQSLPRSPVAMRAP